MFDMGERAIQEVHSGTQRKVPRKRTMNEDVYVCLVEIVRVLSALMFVEWRVGCRLPVALYVFFTEEKRHFIVLAAILQHRSSTGRNVLVIRTGRSAFH